MKMFIFCQAAQGGGHRTLLYGHAILLRHSFSGMVSSNCTKVKMNVIFLEKSYLTNLIFNNEECGELSISLIIVPKIRSCPELDNCSTELAINLTIVPMRNRPTLRDFPVIQRSFHNLHRVEIYPHLVIVL